jgi:hypothetical protein
MLVYFRHHLNGIVIYVLFLTARFSSSTTTYTAPSRSGFRLRPGVLSGATVTPALPRRLKGSNIGEGTAFES